MESNDNNKIYAKILTKSTKDPDTGCLIWNGQMDNNLCRMGHGSKTITVHTFILKYNNPDLIISRTENIIRTCNNIKCNEITHLQIIPKKKTSTKAEVWERLLKYGEYDDNGCLLWIKKHVVDMVCRQ